MEMEAVLLSIALAIIVYEYNDYKTRKWGENYGEK